jgi:hypothetical protein
LVGLKGDLRPLERAPKAPRGHLRTQRRTSKAPRGKAVGEGVVGGPKGNLKGTAAPPHTQAIENQHPRKMVEAQEPQGFKQYPTL